MYRRFKRRDGLIFGIGVFFIVLSFMVYFVYPLIPFLPFSTRSKVIASLAVWGVGWVIFSAGLMLSGKEGYRRFKDILKKLLARLRT